MSDPIVVIDYHKGNLKSVERGLLGVGADVRVTDNPAVIARASTLVLPGVGAFGDATATMAALGQTEAIQSALESGAAFLGICLGLHLMYEAGQERSLDEDGEPDGGDLPRGLGLLPGVCRRIHRFDENGRAYKVPHVGWNTIECAASDEAQRLWHACPLLDGIEPGEYFYFTHSYRAPDGPATVATTRHSEPFPSVVAAGDHVFGVQFHPEKSSEVGIRLLGNFVTLAAKRR